MTPDDLPFLTGASSHGETSTAAAPAALFDLAVNRAHAALRGLRPGDPAVALAQWHARTRFARRVPLGAVKAALEQRPGRQTQKGGWQESGWQERDWHWAGGPGGGWTPGKAPFP